MATDWRQARAQALLQDADVIQHVLDALAELEQCQAADNRIMAWLRPGAGLLKTCMRDLTREAERLVDEAAA